jgi:hypothetical protein
MPAAALEAAVDAAEALLVRAEFEPARRAAADALAAAAASPAADAAARDAADRAAVVLLQALFESGRFAGARGALERAFGSLEGAPANAILLWASFALDVRDEADAAAALLVRLLAGAPPAPRPGWSRRQFLQLLHLYLLEVLLPEARDAALVRGWLQSGGGAAIALEPDERALLEREVDAAAAERGAAPARTAAQAARRRSSACLAALGAPPPLWAEGGGGDAGGASDAGDWLSMPSPSRGSLDAPSPRASPPPAARRPTARRPAAASAAAAEVDPDDLDLLGRWQRRAFDAAAHTYSRVAELARAPAPPAAAACVAASAALALAAAAYARRGALRRRVRGAARWAARAAGELAAMAGAAGVSVNPMAAPRH